ncbi:ER degradation-enhancing alpha-mannosidase-like protein 1 [Yarrowia sp. B02]|nr:ER degradation-enhancing alpha-mannosidase-like protein 1 [Yarrowia sp. B02]
MKWWLVTPVLALDFSARSLLSLRNDSESLFDHAFGSYMRHGFPLDEVRPMACEGVTRDKDETNLGRNDLMGGWPVTLIDSLDTLAVMGRRDDFAEGVRQVLHHVKDFDYDATVQVFETTIRTLGGLLSAHTYASSPDLGMEIAGYQGELLKLATDLGDRLLRAFEGVEHGIPHPRVNLRRGIRPVGGKYITDACAAGGGSLLLEFGLLSKLTREKKYIEAAEKSFFAIWELRSSRDLLPMGIDQETLRVTSAMSGVGASADSYYEYALKWYLMSGDERFWEVYQRSRRAIDTWNTHPDTWHHYNVHYVTGEGVAPWIDSLSAFFPTLDVLTGNLKRAIRTHLTHMKLWNTYAGIPERWRFTDAQVDLEWYPLRPELVESTYYLYRATGDVFYLQCGRKIMSDLNIRNKVACGYAGTQNVRTGELADRMESFFMSETAKYLYLLFDKDNSLNRDSRQFIWSTEGHPLYFDDAVLSNSYAEKRPRPSTALEETNGTALVCPNFNHPSGPFSIVGAWPHLYDLNARYKYDKPWYLRPIVKRRWSTLLRKLRNDGTSVVKKGMMADAEMEDGFYERYVAGSRPTCAAILDGDMHDVSFGSDQSSVLPPLYQEPDTKTGYLDFESLEGVKLTLVARDNYFWVHTVNGVGCQGANIDWYYNVPNKVISINRDTGLLNFRGRDVPNIRIGKVIS